MPGWRLAGIDAAVAARVTTWMFYYSTFIMVLGCPWPVAPFDLSVTPARVAPFSPEPRLHRLD